MCRLPSVETLFSATNVSEVPGLVTKVAMNLFSSKQTFIGVHDDDWSSTGRGETPSSALHMKKTKLARLAKLYKRSNDHRAGHKKKNQKNPKEGNPDTAVNIT